jgi:hypothetical protein
MNTAKRVRLRLFSPMGYWTRNILHLFHSKDNRANLEPASCVSSANTVPGSGVSGKVDDHPVDRPVRWDGTARPRLASQIAKPDANQTAVHDYADCAGLCVHDWLLPRVSTSEAERRSRFRSLGGRDGRRWLGYLLKRLSRIQRLHDLGRGGSDSRPRPLHAEGCPSCRHCRRIEVHVPHRRSDWSGGKAGVA